MTRKGFIGIVAVVVITVWSQWGASTGGSDTRSQMGIPPETVADYLHAVIEADRTFYTLHVVERLQAKGIVVASQNWLHAGTLPLPVQFLMESNRLASMTGAKIRYRLISLWPINEQNKAASEFEQTALKNVLANPDRPHTGFIQDGERRFFQAIYADKAVSQSCIGCHNAHPNSPKRNFKLDDVMGGIVINFPVDQ